MFEEFITLSRLHDRDKEVMEVDLGVRQDYETRYARTLINLEEISAIKQRFEVIDGQEKELTRIYLYHELIMFIDVIASYQHVSNLFLTYRKSIEDGDQAD